jgi:hypothetical protein
MNVLADLGFKEHTIVDIIQGEEVRPDGQHDHCECERQKLYNDMSVRLKISFERHGPQRMG